MSIVSHSGEIKHFVLLFRFYRIRAERLEWFTNRDPFDIKLAALLNLGLFLPLESKDINNNQVFLVRTGVHSPRKHNQNDVFKV